MSTTRSVKILCSLHFSFGYLECHLSRCLMNLCLICTLVKHYCYYPYKLIYCRFSIAALLTHVLATVWGGIQVSSTATFHSAFTLITQSACHTNLLPQYWKERQDAELPSLILNVVALLVSAFLSWRLMKVNGFFPLLIRQLLNSVAHSHLDGRRSSALGLL